MGVHAHLYLGPYVECTIPVRIEEVQVEGCPNTSCPKEKPKSYYHRVTTTFCATCGTKIEMLTIKTERRPSHYDVLPDDVLTELNTSDSKKNTLYLAPNRIRGAAGRKFHLDADLDHHVDMEPSAFNRSAEIEWFTANYADVLEKLRGAYENVQVKWGFHYYFY